MLKNLLIGAVLAGAAAMTSNHCLTGAVLKMGRCKSRWVRSQDSNVRLEHLLASSGPDGVEQLRSRGTGSVAEESGLVATAPDAGQLRMGHQAATWTACAVHRRRDRRRRGRRLKQ